MNEYDKEEEKILQNPSSIIFMYMLCLVYLLVCIIIVFIFLFFPHDGSTHVGAPNCKCIPFFHYIVQGGIDPQFFPQFPQFSVISTIFLQFFSFRNFLQEPEMESQNEFRPFCEWFTKEPRCFFVANLSKFATLHRFWQKFDNFLAFFSFFPFFCWVFEINSHPGPVFCYLGPHFSSIFCHFLCFFLTNKSTFLKSASSQNYKKNHVF